MGCQVDTTCCTCKGTLYTTRDPRVTSDFLRLGSGHAWRVPVTDAHAPLLLGARSGSGSGSDCACYPCGSFTLARLRSKSPEPM